MKNTLHYWCLFLCLVLCHAAMAQSAVSGKVQYVAIEDFEWRDSTTFPVPDIYNAYRAELVFEEQQALYHEYTVAGEEERKAALQKQLEKLKEEAGEAKESGQQNLSFHLRVPKGEKQYYILTKRAPRLAFLWEYGHPSGYIRKWLW